MNIEYGSKIIRLDFPALKKGIVDLARDCGVKRYETLTTDQLAPVEFGMVDITVAEQFKTMFTGSIHDMLSEKLKSLGVAEGDYNDIIPFTWVNELIAECETAFFLGIMDAAKVADALIV